MKPFSWVVDRLWFFAVAVAIFGGVSIAASVNVPNPSSSNYVFKTDTDGTNQYGAQTLWGIAGDNEVDVTSGHGLFVDLMQLGGSAPSVTNPFPTAPNPYPLGAVPITASATGTTAATTATLTAVTSHTTYICGYSIRANATAATTVLDTVTGVITATMSSELWVAPNTSGLGVDEQIFSPCIPASGVSTNIAVVSGAPGAGGLVSVKAWGYSL
jgi:hypothetical protein